MRPHIIWFGEQLDDIDMEKSYAAVENSDVLLVIGTSGIVHPAASFAGIAKQNGAYVVEINLEETPVSENMDITILGKAKDILPLLIQ